MSLPTGTVLVTGAGGFVGSAVVRRLVQAMRRAQGRPTFADGRPVTHVVALLRPDGNAARLEDLSPGTEWSLLRGDLGSSETVGLLSAVRPQAVLHLALDARCHVTEGESEQRALLEPPLTVLFDILRRTPGAHIVTTGSVAVLSPGAALDESAPTCPSPGYLHYARAKLLEEALIEQFGARTGVRWSHLRLFYLFGRYEESTRLLPYLVRALAHGQPAQLSAGLQLRDYTDVDDVAEAYGRALAVPSGLGNRIYHIGSGVGTSVRDFAAVVAAAVGRPDLLQFGSLHSMEAEIPVLVANADRARHEMGWNAPDPIARLQQAAAWTLARERANMHPRHVVHTTHEK